MVIRVIHNMTYQPTQTLAQAQSRATMLSDIRKFFTDKGIMEVTTPILSNSGNTDVFIESVTTYFHQAGIPTVGYLHTSPEFAMKRLLAAWQVPVYQICQVFRDNERGTKHNTEFTMLEWYRPHFSLDDLAEELRQLISIVMGKPIMFKKLSYAQSFSHLGIHPYKDTVSTFKECATSHGIYLDMADDRQGWLDLLFSHLIESDLGKDMPTLVVDYPPKTAALAKTERDVDGFLIAKRFELYINGIELANAYDELADGDELFIRFTLDNKKRQKLGLPLMPIDKNLIAACNDLPPCSGIALGVDRLFMICNQLPHINHAIAITTDKA